MNSILLSKVIDYIKWLVIVDKVKTMILSANDIIFMPDLNNLL